LYHFIKGHLLTIAQFFVFLMYSDASVTREEQPDMPKTKLAGSGEERFGMRLARMRQAAGYSQRELARELRISQRMLAYYESQSAHPPAHLLPLLAQVLGVTTDQLLGIDAVKAQGRTSTRDTRLWRRFAQIEKLSPAERKPIIQVLDAFLAKAKLTTDDERRV
jgi:transcriptional regulator with XRE-family HTH domain